MKRLLNNRGENETPETPAVEPKFTQADVDRIINKRFANYKTLEEQNAELMQFKTEHEKQQDLNKQKELEEQKLYEEAKKGYEGKIGELSQVLSQKDQAINDMKVGFALQNEALKLNAVPEVIDLMKGLAVVQDDGSIKIKGKDANGIDTLLTLEQGVEQFLKAKPYLVKASAQGGSGSATDLDQGGKNIKAEDDLTSLNDQLMKAMQSGENKLATEISAKIKKLQASKGISAFI